MSFVERLSSFGGSKCIRTIGKQIFGTLTCVLCIEKSIILCPYLGGSTVGSSTVFIVVQWPRYVVIIYEYFSYPNELITLGIPIIEASWTVSVIFCLV